MCKSAGCTDKSTQLAVSSERGAARHVNCNNGQVRVNIILKHDGLCSVWLRKAIGCVGLKSHGLQASEGLRKKKFRSLKKEKPRSSRAVYLRLCLCLEP